MALSQEEIDAEVVKMQKCIASGEIVKIDLGEKHGACFQDIKVILKGESGYYSFNSSILIDECTYDTYYEVFNKDFVDQIGKNQKFLIDSKKNLIISKKQYDFEKYSNLEMCLPNTKDVNLFYSNYTIYIYILIGIIFGIAIFKIYVFLGKKF